ncbi:phage head closure protein [Novosphingobium humi]|uniref:Phage head closure protein n=1 Tax=Novosphingobium humi TaxID=2282397 RepID=A0ABY7U1X8_9SPHN|nr:phage head closure protein [Novosphingobium humi]WCT78882.1 phage head closure protein [Novosphingobium humi]
MAHSTLGAGRLRHPIKIRRAVLVNNGRGGQTKQWQTIASPRAEIIGLDGREAMIGHALTGISVSRVTIRWRAGILATDQVRLADGTNLAIAAPPYDPFGTRKWLTILATTEGVEPDDGQ